MSVTEMNKDYVAMIQKWSRCRDFFSGADALRQHDIALRGDVNLAYLPRLSSKQSYVSIHAPRAGSDYRVL